MYELVRQDVSKKWAMVKFKINMVKKKDSTEQKLSLARARHLSEQSHARNQSSRKPNISTLDILEAPRKLTTFLVYTGSRNH